MLPVGTPAPQTSTSTVRAVGDSFDLPEDRFLVLFVGRDVPKKGLEHVLGAHDDAYDIVAVTDRPASRTTRARILPFMPQEPAPGASRSRGCVRAPVGRRRLPLVVQEAFGAGLPVVTTAGEGYERYVTPDDVLFVQPSGDAIRAALRRLVHEPAHREALASRARRVATSELGLDGFVGAYEELYERLVREDGRR